MSDMWGERPNLDALWVGQAQHMVGSSFRTGETWNIAWKPAFAAVTRRTGDVAVCSTLPPYAQFQLREGIVWGKWSDRGDWSVVA